ncbi:hypothetical protein [Mucilaginibacter gotjawali]|uniref:Uncharacterized protein n=2 Tax=Mucilaginibacter gotjawali TaxID=1550579 RepID=A0A839SKV6_9SPHI|nr:hypothetical protein [Mucilaginibacter gotjawali]MBB3057874.1 hypothetical protein [Mucilaginibacter gotjawali]BAU52354.1 hypothetical protein MgSA37_00509 [Mucilaginibacter gotjawali]
MVAFKYLSIIIIGFYVFAQLFSIVPQLKGPQTITVYKENNLDTTAYIKGYKTADTKVEVFDVKVTPNSFWDRLLLTHQDENIMVDILKAACGMAFAWYFFKLKYDNVFSKRSLNLFWLALSLCVMIFLALSIGQDHTSDFYCALFLAKGGDELTKYDFQRQLIRNTTQHDLWIYMWVPMIILNFYKAFKLHHEGKSEEEMFW